MVGSSRACTLAYYNMATIAGLKSSLLSAPSLTFAGKARNLPWRGAPQGFESFFFIPK